jgi:hypothetical protein
MTELSDYQRIVEEPMIRQYDATIREQRLEIERLRDKAEGLDADLDSALAVLIRRIKGEADLASAKLWLGLNYRALFVEEFPGETPPDPRILELSN